MAGAAAARHRGAGSRRAQDGPRPAQDGTPRAAAGCICVNGRLCQPDRAFVSALDAGFLLGDGLFESLRASGGAPYLLERHLRRLLEAAARLQFAHLPSAEEIRSQVLRTVRRAALPEAYVRITLTRGTGGVGLVPPDGPPTVVVAALPAPPPVPAGGAIAAALLPRARGPRMAAKSTSWQSAVVSRRRVQAGGAAEGLYVSARGNVLEGVSSNVFAVVDGRLLTPPVRHCLPGVTRARVLELARAHGLPAVEAPLSVGVLMSSQEAFVTNAVQGLRALAGIDGAALRRQGATGVFATMHRLYARDRTAGGGD
jgi:branched-subunit amino acid aminotransferase/4-amino-4-deoxychorismate lyase